MAFARRRRAGRVAIISSSTAVDVTGVRAVRVFASLPATAESPGECRQYRGARQCPVAALDAVAIPGTWPDPTKRDVSFRIIGSKSVRHLHGDGAAMTGAGARRGGDRAPRSALIVGGSLAGLFIGAILHSPGLAGPRVRAGHREPGESRGRHRDARAAVRCVRSRRGDGRQRDRRRDRRPRRIRQVGPRNRPLPVSGRS